MGQQQSDDLQGRRYRSAGTEPDESTGGHRHKWLFEADGVQTARLIRRGADDTLEFVCALDRQLDQGVYRFAVEAVVLRRGDGEPKRFETDGDEPLLSFVVVDTSNSLVSLRFDEVHVALSWREHATHDLIEDNHPYIGLELFSC